MTTPRELMTGLGQRVAGQADAAAKIGATFCFEVSGENGGRWLVRLVPTAGVFEQSATDPAPAADCTLCLKDVDLVELFEGRLSGQQLFFDGKLDIQGDLTLALKLQELTALMRE